MAMFISKDNSAATEVKPKKPFNIYKAGIRAVLYTSILTFSGAKVLDLNSVTGAQFGQNANLLGDFNRVVINLKCGEDCISISDIQNKSKDAGYKAIDDSLKILEKSDIGQETLQVAHQNDVIFNSDQSFFQESCSAMAMFNMQTGHLHYYQPEGVDHDRARLTHLLSHELYHGKQAINAPDVNLPNLNKLNDKERAMVVMIREAAAYVATAKTLHDLWLQEDITTPEYQREATTAITAVDYITSYNISTKRDGLDHEAASEKATYDTFIKFFEKKDYLIPRLGYLTGLGLSLSTFDIDVEDLTIEMLKPLATLPNGQNIIPNDFTIQDLHRYVQSDIISYAQQWRISEPGIEVAGNVNMQMQMGQQPTLKQFKQATCQKRAAVPSA